MGGNLSRGTRWELVSQDDGTEGWTWQQVGIDEAILQASEPHSTFGKAIYHALAHGFSPAVDHWVIKSGGWITHFAPGASPITITPDDRAIQRPEAARGGAPESNAGTAADDSTPQRRGGED